MATPHVSGAAALALAKLPGWGAAQLKAALIDGVDRSPGLAGTSVSGGRLNAAASVGIAARSQVAQVPATPAAAPPGATANSRVAAALAPAVAPRISRLRIKVRRRARTATLAFRLAAEADVILRLERRRCSRGRCRWRLAGTRSRHTPAGRARLVVGPRLDLKLARGTWRVTLVTAAGSVRRRFELR